MTTLLHIDRTWLTWGESPKWSVRLDQIVSVKSGVNTTDGRGWLRIYAIGDDGPWKINYSVQATGSSKMHLDHRRVMMAVDTVLHGAKRRQQVGIQYGRDEDDDPVHLT